MQTADGRGSDVFVFVAVEYTRSASTPTAVLALHSKVGPARLPEFSPNDGVSLQPFCHAIEPNMTMTDQLKRDCFFIVHMLTDVSEQLPMHLATFAANGRLAANGRAVFSILPLDVT